MMRINDVDIATIGFEMTDRSLPVLPTTEENTVKLAATDGLLDFGSTYGARPLNVTLYCFATDYHGALAKLAALLNVRNGPAYVEFADIPDRWYPVVASGSLNVGATGSRTVDLPLKMNDPWPQSRHDTAIMTYNDGISYGQGYYYNDTSAYFNAPGTLIIRNNGTIPQAPKLRISGAFTSLTISDGQSTLSIDGPSTASDVWIVDCAKYTVKKNGVNAYAASNRVFFTLAPGETVYSVGGAGLAVNVEFIFKHKYLY